MCESALFDRNEGKPTKPSGCCTQMGHGDVEAGFADVVIESPIRPKPTVHRASRLLGVSEP